MNNSSQQPPTAKRKGRGFRDLRVWQAGIDLAEAVYHSTGSFPKPAPFGLAAHMQRTATQIPASIAEGHSAGQPEAFLRHLCSAQASLAELETQVEIARRLRHIAGAEEQRLHKLILSLTKQVRALSQCIRDNRGRVVKNAAPNRPADGIPSPARIDSP